MGIEPISSHVKGECPNQLDERSIYKYKYFVFKFQTLLGLFCGDRKTRTSEPEGEHLQCPAIAAMRYPQFSLFLTS